MKISSAFAQYINAVLNISASSTSTSTSRTELDSHADSPVVGKNAIILYKKEMTVNVNPFSDDFVMMPEILVVHAAVSYDCPITGTTSILLINNTLYITEMEQNLLPPIMMRLNGVMVDECPKFLCVKPTIENHSIFLPTENFRIPLQIHGTTSYIPTRSPDGMKEVNAHQNLQLTSENPEWDPSSTIYEEQENDMTNWNGEMRTRKKHNRKVFRVKVPLSPIPSSVTPAPVPSIISDAFTSSLLEKVNISSISSSRRNRVSP